MTGKTRQNESSSNAYVTEIQIDVLEIQRILSRGNTAEVKKNKDGIVILEVRKKIVKSDVERG